MSTENIRIAIQKSGRLSEDSLKLFKECGIKFEAHGSKLRSVSSNFPIEFLFLRDDDIPGYVEDGVADLGVIGLNVLMEQKRKVDIVKEFEVGGVFDVAKLRVGMRRPAGRKPHKSQKNNKTTHATILPTFFEGAIHGFSVWQEIVDHGCPVQPFHRLRDCPCLPRAGRRAGGAW